VTSVEQVIPATAAYYSVPIEELVGPGRLRALVVARQIAMYLASDITGLAPEAIGSYFNRDEWSVRHAKRRMEELLETSGALRQRMQHIRRRIGEEQ
jgi:chromosomal replication initiator protein